MIGRSLAILCALSVTGCSFVFVEGPPDDHRQQPYVGCTSSRMSPILDTIFTGLQLANLGVAVSKDDMEWDEQYDGEPPFERDTAIGIYSAFVLLGAAGMYYGFTRTSECRDAQDELAARRRMMPLAPAPAAAPR